MVTPVLWTNQALSAFHGTILRHAEAILTDGVTIDIGRATTDFGRGFYATTLERQARAWAYQLSLRSAGQAGSSPTVVRFDLSRDDLAGMESLAFVRGAYDADDFWSLVFSCRNGGNHGRPALGWYDLVIGPVAAPWRRREALPDADQMSFHTPLAEGMLNSCRKYLLP